MATLEARRTGERPSEGLGRKRCHLPGGRRGDLRPHRPERLGEDDHLQLINNFFPITAGDIFFKGQKHQGAQDAPDLPSGHRADLPGGEAPGADDRAGQRDRLGFLPGEHASKRPRARLCEALDFCNLDTVRTSRPRAFRSAGANGWRSPGRWPPGRSSSFWTKPRPA